MARSKIGDIVMVDGERHVVIRSGPFGEIRTMPEQEFIDRRTLDASTMMTVYELKQRDRDRRGPLS